MESSKSWTLIMGKTETEWRGTGIAYTTSKEDAWDGGREPEDHEVGGHLSEDEWHAAVGHPAEDGLGGQQQDKSY